MISLLGLPEDVFLEISTYLEILDVSSLLATCRTLRVYLSSRSLWILVLNSARNSGIYPLPCPPKQDFMKLDLVDLRQMGLRACRLQQNLTLAKPRPLSPIRTIRLYDDEKILTAIPGTELVITYSALRKKVICWDTSSARCIGYLDFKIFHLFSISQSTDEEGKFLLALGRDNSKARFVSVICVDYHNPNGPTVEIIFERKILWILDGFHYTFVDPEVVGVVVHDTVLLSLSCSIFNMITHSSAYFTTDPLPSTNNCCCCCYLFQRNIYIHPEAPGYGIAIHRIPREFLPYIGNLNHPDVEIVAPISLEANLSYHDPEQMYYPRWYPLVSRPGMPRFDVHAITRRVSDEDSTRTAFLFWPVNFSPVEDSPLTFSAASYDYHLFGDDERHRYFFGAVTHQTCLVQ